MSKWKFRYVVALFAGMGLLAPPVVLFIGGYLHWGGDWLTIFWPSIYTLLGDTFRPPTWLEVVSDWSVAIGINVLLYALVGAIVWSILAGVRKLRAVSN